MSLAPNFSPEVSIYKMKLSSPGGISEDKFVGFFENRSYGRLAAILGIGTAALLACSAFKQHIFPSQDFLVDDVDAKKDESKLTEIEIDPKTPLNSSKHSKLFSSQVPQHMKVAIVSEFDGNQENVLNTQNQTVPDAESIKKQADSETQNSNPKNLLELLQKELVDDGPEISEIQNKNVSEEENFDVIKVPSQKQTSPTEALPEHQLVPLLSTPTTTTFNASHELMLIKTPTELGAQYESEVQISQNPTTVEEPKEIQQPQPVEIFPVPEDIPFHHMPTVLHEMSTELKNTVLELPIPESQQIAQEPATPYVVDGDTQTEEILKQGQEFINKQQLQSPRGFFASSVYPFGLQLETYVRVANLNQNEAGFNTNQGQAWVQFGNEQFLNVGYANNSLPTSTILQKPNDLGYLQDLDKATKAVMKNFFSRKSIRKPSPKNKNGSELEKFGHLQ